MYRTFVSVHEGGGEVERGGGANQNQITSIPSAKLDIVGS